MKWHHRAISAYTWCITEKGPQRRWLHKIGKEDTGMPLPEPDGAIRQAHSGRVREADRVEKGGGERTENGGVADTPLKRQREGKMGHGGRERERKRSNKGKWRVSSVRYINF